MVQMNQLLSFIGFVVFVASGRSNSAVGNGHAFLVVLSETAFPLLASCVGVWDGGKKLNTWMGHVGTLSRAIMAASRGCLT